MRKIRKTVRTRRANPGAWKSSGKNLHVIEAKYLAPTNTMGARVKLNSMRFPGDSVTFTYNHRYNSILEMAKAWLIKHRYRIVGQAENAKRDSYLLMSSTFQPLADTKHSGKATRRR